jgi:hypothetical protein
VVTVESVRSDGAVLTQCGKEIPSRFRQFAHGYVVTSHKTQGRTARHVIVAAERLDGKAAYVGCSRGRESCDVYTVDKERLFAGLPFDGNRRASSTESYSWHIVRGENPGRPMQPLCQLRPIPSPNKSPAAPRPPAFLARFLISSRHVRVRLVIQKIF